jgi:hypothetical protein
MSNLIESVTAVEGQPDAESTAGEWSAWAIRRRLPSELVHKPALRWPGEVEDLTGIPGSTLKAKRAEGDHPRLLAIGRALFVRPSDLAEWLDAHVLPAGALVRPATVARGSKITRERCA